MRGFVPTSRLLWPTMVFALLVGAALVIATTPASSSSQTCDSVSATTGSDLTGTGSQGNPWRTAQKLADSLTPGQTGCLRGGVYTEDVTATQDGNSGARITVRSWPGETAALRPARSTPQVP